MPAIDMNSSHDVLNFISSHMRDLSKFHCMPHVLEKISRSFALSGRDEALNSAAAAFEVLSKPTEASDRIKRRRGVTIPYRLYSRL